MKATTETTSGTGERTGLQFISIEEASVKDEVRIHDAEGVAVTVGDEIEKVVQSHRTGSTPQESRTFGRVLEVRTEATIHKPAAVVVGWNHNQRVGEIDPVVFENFCRVLVSVGGERTPAAAVAGTDDLADRVTRDRDGNEIRTGDDVRYILDGAPFRDEDTLRGRVFNSLDGWLFVHWSDGSESVVTAADVRSKIVLVKSRS